MSSEVVVATPPLLPALDELVDEARGYLAAAEAVSTRRNYATDWRAFSLGAPQLLDHRGDEAGDEGGDAVDHQGQAQGLCRLVGELAVADIAVVGEVHPLT